MPAHKLVDAPKAPQPPGPFSHATVVGPWVYVSGMGVPLQLSTGTFCGPARLIWQEDRI